MTRSDGDAVFCTKQHFSLRGEEKEKPAVASRVHKQKKQIQYRNNLKKVNQKCQSHKSHIDR